MDLSKARILFDALIIKYPLCKEYLASDAAIVKSPAFESGVCKVLSNQEKLTSVEKLVLLPFEKEQDAVGEEASFAERVLKKPRMNLYEDLRYIPPTSNHAERFFSAAKLHVPSLRQSMLPKNLEMLLFLKYNRSFWNIELFYDAYKNEIEEIDN